MCGDFLKDLGVSADHLVFESCKKAEPVPAVVLRTTYTVSSEKWKLVEDVLHEKFGLKRLKFVCCYMETRPVDHIDDDGINYSINMYSSEFEESEEGMTFEKFYVVVDKYLVLP